MLLLNLRDAQGPLYRRVYLALKAMIRDGRLAPAARLPSTRELAADLGVSRNTVMHASPPPRAGLLIGYASLTEADIREGIRRMADVVSAIRTSTTRAPNRATDRSG